jgi:hypothetical protein
MGNMPDINSEESKRKGRWRIQSILMDFNYEGNGETGASEKKAETNFQ